MRCHGSRAVEAPPFSRLLHRVHLVGGPENLFLSMFQGECTHCHKLDPATGRWSLASGSEAGVREP
jgi:mono/diheme cytochrome c family protein